MQTAETHKPNWSSGRPENPIRQLTRENRKPIYNETVETNKPENHLEA